MQTAQESTLGDLTPAQQTLAELPRLVHAEIVSLRVDGSREGLEVERRFLEFGFVEGVRIRILHEGIVGRDPIIVEIDDMRIALRRRQAAFVVIRVLSGEKAP